MEASQTVLPIHLGGTRVEEGQKKKATGVETYYVTVLFVFFEAIILEAQTEAFSLWEWNTPKLEGYAERAEESFVLTLAHSVSQKV